MLNAPENKRATIFPSVEYAVTLKSHCFMSCRLCQNVVLQDMYFYNNNNTQNAAVAPRPSTTHPLLVHSACQNGSLLMHSSVTEWLDS